MPGSLTSLGYILKYHHIREVLLNYSMSNRSPQSQMPYIFSPTSSPPNKHICCLSALSSINTSSLEYNLQGRRGFVLFRLGAALMDHMDSFTLTL